MAAYDDLDDIDDAHDLSRLPLEARERIRRYLELGIADDLARFKQRYSTDEAEMAIYESMMRIYIDEALGDRPRPDDE